jgi:hypothetical protein
MREADMSEARARPTPGRTFRIVSAVLGILLIVLAVPFAVVAIASNDVVQTIHRFHATTGAVASLVLAAPLLVLAVRPSAIAAMQLFVAGAVVSAAVGLIAGDLFTGLLFVGLVLAAIVLALYPYRAEVWRATHPRLSLVAVAVVTAVPAVAYALTQASLQRHALPGDPHRDAHHYSGVAVAAVAMPATVLVAAIGARGWPIVGRIASAAFLAFGLSALAFAGYVSAPGATWAWASVATGFVVLAMTELETRRASAPWSVA